jgi:ubiquinone/menaquinone biosynthesis C-methylase UbiE
MDAETLLFLDGSFSAATAFFSLMYLAEEKLGRVLREVHRVLKPGGEFLVWDTVIPKRPPGAREVVAVRVIARLPDREIRTGYGCRWPAAGRSPDLYARIAKTAGFAVVVAEVTEGGLFMRLGKTGGQS